MRNQEAIKTRAGRMRKSVPQFSLDVRVVPDV
jgi:hypothetical protein